MNLSGKIYRQNLLFKCLCDQVSKLRLPNNLSKTIVELLEKALLGVRALKRISYPTLNILT
jgi:hypothetical protein